MRPARAMPGGPEGRNGPAPPATAGDGTLLSGEVFGPFFYEELQANIS